MESRTLGSSGCAVSSLCLGTMTFGAETDEPGAHQQLDRFIEAGGNLVDTADVYAAGRSEEIIGRWFASRPADLTEPVVLATKGRFPQGGDGSPNGAGLSARHLTRALDASLGTTGRPRRPGAPPRPGDAPTRGREPSDRRGTERTWNVIDAVQKVAEDRGVSMAEVALAWVTARPAVTSTILGARTLEQLDANLRSADLELTAAETAALDAASYPQVVDYPYGELGEDERS